MILGRGTATTDTEIIADYHQFLTNHREIHSQYVRRGLFATPVVMCKRIGKPISEWKDEDIEAIVAHRVKQTIYYYQCFLVFLYFRGYRRASNSLLAKLNIRLCSHWTSFVEPYRMRIAQAQQELGYADPDKAVGEEGKIVRSLLTLIICTGKPLEQITRADFEAWEQEYQYWYKRERSSSGVPDRRVARLERFLIHWKILPPKRRIYRHEEHFARIQQPDIQEAILRYMTWCEAKYRPSTIDNYRIGLFTFFHWLQQQFPKVDSLDGISRVAALSYGNYLKEQAEAGRYGKNYCHGLYNAIRLFFDFLVEEHFENSPARNPFSARDLPKRSDMLPRYLTDQELRAILSYAEQDATLLERTMIITLLHTGIRAAEFVGLKVSDIVQIGGVWKLHIHQGKGLKDRMIPLTAPCLAVLQTWQKEGWEQITDDLFTKHGFPWRSIGPVSERMRQIGNKLGIVGLSAHRFRHSFAVALLNYGIRESALQKLMGHADLSVTLEYARILDETVERSFTQALDQMEQGAHSWVPNFFVQEDYTLFVEGDAVSWIRLPMGYCRRNVKLHCESDVKCLLCDRFAIGKEDLPRLQQMYERFTKLGLTMKADVVAAQIRRLELPSGEAAGGFIPTTAISATRKHR